MKREPVAIAALVRILTFVAMAFGVQLTPEQIAAVIVVVELVLALITRARVSPV